MPKSRVGKPTVHIKELPGFDNTRLELCTYWAEENTNNIISDLQATTLTLTLDILNPKSIDTRSTTLLNFVIPIRGFRFIVLRCILRSVCHDVYYGSASAVRRQIGGPC